MKPISTAIRMVRTTRQLTQAETARRAGMSESFIGAIERGERDFTWSTLLKICDALQVDVALLVFMCNTDKASYAPFTPLVLSEIWKGNQDGN